MGTRGAIRACIPPTVRNAVCLRATYDASVLIDDMSTGNGLGADMEAAIRMNAAAVAIQCGLRLANGDLLYFPMVSGTILEGYRVTPQNLLTTGYDFSRRAEEKTLPIPDGMTCWLDGTLIRAFRVERLPESLSKAEWLSRRVMATFSKPNLSASCLATDL